MFNKKKHYEVSFIVGSGPVHYYSTVLQYSTVQYSTVQSEVVLTGEQNDNLRVVIECLEMLRKYLSAALFVLT